MHWEDYQAAFQADGTLGILQIKHTSPEDWYRFIDFLSKTYTDLTYTIDGNTRALPDDLRRLELSREHSHLLTIQLGDIKLHCPYFIAEEITFEFDPEEIRNELHAKVLFRFMSTMGRALDKPVILSKQDMPEQALFVYERAQGLRFLNPD